MFLIVSSVDAETGCRDKLVELYKQFVKDFPELRGGKPRILTASIGPSDSTVILESEHATLAEFEAGLEAANKSPKMAEYGPKFAELTIAGTHKFEVYRIHL